MAPGVQDTADRRRAAAEAELEGLTGHPRRVRRQAVEKPGGLVRVGQRGPDQRGIRANVSGEDMLGAGDPARRAAALIAR